MMKGLFACFVWLLAVTSLCRAAEQTAIQIPIRVDVPEFAPKCSWPLSVSIPLPRGVLKSPDDAVLVDQAFRPLACQKEVLATWTPKGDVKWLEVNFSWRSDTAYSILVNSGLATPEAQRRVSVVRADQVITVNTAAIEAVIGPRSRLKINGHDGKTLLNAPEGFLYFVANDGREFRASGSAAETEVVVESEGPTTAIVRLEGWYVDAEGEKCARQITRLQFFAGQPVMKIIHTFVITEDTNHVWFKDIGLQFPFELEGPITAVLDKSHQFTSDVVTVELKEGEEASVFQEVYKHHGEEEARGVTGMIRNGEMDVLSESDRVGEWATARGKDGGITAVIRDFWQTFPKEIEIRPDQMRVHLFSSRGGRELDFRAQTMASYWGKWAGLFKKRQENDPFGLADKPSNAAGLARTHEVWLIFHPAATDVETLARMAHSVQEPILALPDPAWNCATGIFGPLSVYDPQVFPTEERLISDFFDWFTKFGERFGHWGWIEYGVVHAMNYGRGDTGSRGLATTDDTKWRAGYFRYGRSKYGFILNAWQLYMRSGDRKYYDIARIASNHLMDVRMVHWDLPAKFRGAYATGDWEYLHWDTPFFWGSTKADVSLQTFGNLSMLVNEYLYPYYITGQRRSKDVVTERLEAIKKQWKWEKAKEHEERSKYTMLANLAALYSFSWDKKMLEFISLLRPHLIDRESPFGLRHRLMTVYNMPRMSFVDHYIARKAAWALEFADAMQSKEDRAAALRAIRHAYETNVGAGSYAALGLDYSALYLATGDKDILWRLRQLVDNQLNIYWDDENDRFDAETQEKPGMISVMHKAGAVMSTIPYALKVLALERELAMAREMIMAREVMLKYCGAATSPLYVKPVQGGTTVVEVYAGGEMPWGSGAPLEVRSSESRRPGAVWVDTHSTPTQPGTDPFYHSYYHRVTFGPAEPPVPSDEPGTAKPAKWYRLTPGYGSAYRVVGPVGLPTVVRVPSEGFVVGKTLYDTPKPGGKWFFIVPRGVASFALESDGPVRITDPNGNVVRDFEAPLEETTIKVPSGMDEKVWGLQSHEHLTRVQLRGVPPFLAFERPERFFLPEGWEVEAKVDWPRPVADIFTDWQGSNGSAADKGHYLGEKKEYPIRLSELESAALAMSGTIEMWFRPNFNSESLPDGTITRFISSADGKSFTLYAYWNKHNRNSRAFNNGGHHLCADYTKDKIQQRDRVKMMFTAGQWTHLAVAWEVVGAGMDSAIFIDGKKVKTRSDKNWKPEFTIDFGDRLVIGRQGQEKGSLNGVIDEVRISNVVRYKGDFIPQVQPLQADGHTVRLLSFDAE